MSTAMNVIMDIAMNTTTDIRGQAALNKKVEFIMLILLHHQNILHIAGVVLCACGVRKILHWDADIRHAMIVDRS